jgi:hypothetical protein
MSSDAFYPNPHAPSCPWHSAAETFGAPNVKWCETTLCSWISEPANTWSNLGYILIGFYFMYHYRNHHSRLLRMMPAMNVVMGAASLFYHASNFYITQIFDFVGMYLEVLLLVFINFARLTWISSKNIIRNVLIGSVLLTVVLHLLYLSHINFQMIVLILALIIFGTEGLLIKRKLGVPNPAYFFTSIALAIVAITFSILDHKRIFCDPDNHWVQGHAIWHIIASIMFIGLFKHYEQVFDKRHKLI